MADHEEAQDYTALGPTTVGFRTHGARIQKGVDVVGTVIGVDATGGTSDAPGTGVRGLGHHVGVEGIGVDGVGVSGISRGDSGADCIGVRASSQAEGGIGDSASAPAIGIRASGERGGVFSAPIDGAPINLVPAPRPAQEPPRTGRPGDLYVLRALPNPDEGGRFPDAEDQHLAQLWFCLRGDEPQNPAIWGRVQFSEFKP